jgi:hypothetical protein
MFSAGGVFADLAPASPQDPDPLINVIVVPDLPTTEKTAAGVVCTKTRTNIGLSSPCVNAAVVVLGRQGRIGRLRTMTFRAFPPCGIRLRLLY